MTFPDDPAGGNSHVDNPGKESGTDQDIEDEESLGEPIWFNSVIHRIARKRNVDALSVGVFVELAMYSARHSTAGLIPFDAVPAMVRENAPEEELRRGIDGLLRAGLVTETDEGYRIRAWGALVTDQRPPGYPE